MILVASPKKPFIYNSKGSAKRDAVLAAYEDEIASLYSAAAEILPAAGPGTWELSPTIDFVRQSVQNIMGVKHIRDEDDFFNNGCDRYGIFNSRVLYVAC